MTSTTIPESEAVEASLQAWHDALEAHDWIAVAAGLTPDFLMIEHDRILDKAALLAMVTTSGRLGRQQAMLHGFQTRVSRDTAWTTVRNDELWIPDEGPSRPFRFLETAVFQYRGGFWQLSRYHATRLALEAT